MASFSYLFKFILVGDAGVGKSNILSQFIQNRFRNEYDLTVGVEFGSKIVNIEDETIKLQIWDTAGQSSFKNITRGCFRNMICAFLVYNTASRDSFTNIPAWLSELRELGNNNMVIILVGNKIDQEEKRVVSTEEGILLAEQNNLFFIETSAQARRNIDETFMTAVMHIYENIQKGKYDLSNEQCGIKVGKKLE
ncbi:hypothetical protein SteCoe_37461 [Stentor coeruleus]|uniref:Uncharacterized protein n=1 Tax=Stentor coeruleus TaxID=5963 RepID=A0A1R2AMY1_9CILI|nr:hypothetical protein SteCoe_37461 [Stentor coeruleus]